MGGVARELWYDNLATAVAEHDGNSSVSIRASWLCP